ncbi:hypothetical protein EIP91_006047 [Steccherinum ochraceum]|uniref:Uncharacterized protein n=1 Tax=Steccherinum ochraceum TaxID=92696 RepID=A0A4R0R6A1_9APHY|nr:hypothetical protein EIP91_006047 [Steccherinum ochraceum]
MPIYTVSAQARQAHASPSISMEKGTYRIRPPRSRASSTLRHGPSHLNHLSQLSTSSIPSSEASVFERYLFAIVLLLLFGVVFCFAAAYHLFRSSPRVHL